MAIADGLGLKTAEGALVAEPQSDSPTAKAGVLAGDVITAVDGKDVKDPGDLARKIGAMAPGTEVKLSIQRKGEEKTVSLTLGQQPDPRRMRSRLSTPSLPVPQSVFSESMNSAMRRANIVSACADIRGATLHPSGQTRPTNKFLSTPPRGGRTR
jgi:membrane-associated protease RseP (regulator of RpoE activity)